jgi:hypothetical protein
MARSHLSGQTWAQLQLQVYPNLQHSSEEAAPPSLVLGNVCDLKIKARFLCYQHPWMQKWS